VTQQTAPDGAQSVFTYSQRRTKVTALGRGGAGNRTVQWTEVDGLGNLVAVRSGDGNPDPNAPALATVALGYDVVGNLTAVTLPTGAVSSLGYYLF
jgi:hypothetical protein